jgi:hypothetical protein
VEFFLSSVDLVRLVFLIGAVLALVYKKKVGVTPGGIIVPGVITGLLFTSFLAFIITLATTFICYGLYKVTLGRYALSKRWTAFALIGTSVTLSLIATAFVESTHLIGHEIIAFSLVVPGLIAISANKYGMGRVLIGTLAVTAVCYFIAWALILAIPYALLSHTTVELGQYQQLSLTNPYVTIPISLLTAIILYYKFNIRSGGYLVAPFIAAVTFSSPIQTLMLIAGVALSTIAVRLALRYTLIIGLERFVFSIFCGYIMVSIMDFIAISATIPGYRPAPLVLIVAVAILTNDLSLQPIGKTLKNGFAPSTLLAHLTRLAV